MNRFCLQAHFYQRLLALDDGEARKIAENYLKENPIGDLYDSVLIPALSLAEKDRHMNVLDETRTTFIHQTTRELIEELYESYQTVPNAESNESAPSPVEIQSASGLRIVCVPARDEADEIVAMMVMQLLRRAGHNAEALPIGAVSSMVEQVEQRDAEVICISALPPFATSQAKSLCKQLRQRCPEAKIVLGLWEFPGGITKAQERVGNSCANAIGTSLAQVTSLIGAENPLAF